MIGSGDKAEWRSRDKAVAFLAKFNNDTAFEDYKDKVALWNYTTNLTTQNKQPRLTFSAFYTQMQFNASKFDTQKLKPDTRRQILFIISSVMPKDEGVMRRITELVSSMTGICSTSKVQDKRQGQRQNTRNGPRFVRYLYQLA